MPGRRDASPEKVWQEGFRGGGAELKRARWCSLPQSCWLSHATVTARLTFVFYYQTPNLIPVSTGRQNKAFPWGGFFCFLLWINVFLTACALQPLLQETLTLTVFTVSFCASPSISNSKSLFEEPDQKHIQSNQS